MKLKTVYVCEQCNHQSSKWLGKCPQCNAWNSFHEDVIDTKAEKATTKATPTPLVPLSRTTKQDTPRLTTGITEWDRVIGGGIVPGNLMLIGGEPGIGKSTLMLQICDKIATQGKKVLYISGEESPHQISLRAQRLNALSEGINIIPSHSLESALATISQETPDFIILDSIQVIASDQLPGGAGTVSQIRYCTESMMALAKKTGIPILIIGHVTKEGNIAGPRVLEHLVDTVLYMEGDRYHQLRMLRCVKNRFGSTNEVGLFEMDEEGLKEVTNAAKFFLEDRNEKTFGSALTLTIEGNRPFIIEVQALTNITAFGHPKRTASGFDLNRLQLIIAILQKHAGINLQNQDVFVNVTGGFKLHEPAVDLSIAAAIASSFYKTPLPATTVFLGELGLTGEVRPITQLKKRLKEAEQLGLTHMILPKSKTKLSSKLNLGECKYVKEALQSFF